MSSGLDPNIKDIVFEDKNPHDLVLAPVIKTKDFYYVELDNPFEARKTRGEKITEGSRPGNRNSFFRPIVVDRSHNGR